MHVHTHTHIRQRQTHTYTRPRHGAVGHIKNSIDQVHVRELSPQAAVEYERVYLHRGHNVFKDCRQIAEPIEKLMCVQKGIAVVLLARQNMRGTRTRSRRHIGDGALQCPPTYATAPPWKMSV